MASGPETTPPIRREVDAKLRDRSQADRKLLLVGILNKHLPKNARAVLVGGAAVELYTGGGYVTGDVDLVAERSLVRERMLWAGFQEDGRYFVREDIGLVVEVPSHTLRPSETPIEIEFEGYAVPVVSVEDVIVDRLLAAKFWKSASDWEQAILLYGAHRSRLNRQSLEDKARANSVEDRVRELDRLTTAAASGPKGRAQSFKGRKPQE